MDYGIIHKTNAFKLKVVAIKKFVLTFKTFDDLISCSIYLQNLSSSTLYKWGKGYRLIISLKAPINFLIIKEFCTAVKSGDTEFSLTEEYGKYIYGCDAVEKINKAFNKL